MSRYCIYSRVCSIMLDICVTSKYFYRTLFEGYVKPGGTIVESTGGNTGIGLAHMCLALGFKCVIYMPNNQSQVKRRVPSK